MKTLGDGMFVYTDEGWSRHVADMQQHRQREIDTKAILKSIFAKLSEHEIDAIKTAADYEWLEDLDSVWTPDLKESDADDWF